METSLDGLESSEIDELLVFRDEVDEFLEHLLCNYGIEIFFLKFVCEFWTSNYRVSYTAA